MSDIFILDDRPDDDAEVIKRREKQWNEFTPEEQAEIDRRVADMQARIAAKKKNNH